MKNRNQVRNKCSKHGVLEIDELYIHDGEPRCNVCNSILVFSDFPDNKIEDLKNNGGEDMTKINIREARDGLADKILNFAKKLDTGVKDNEGEHLKMVRKSVSRVHFLLTQEINGSAKK